MMKKVNNIFLKFFLPLLFFLCGVVSAFSEKHNKIYMIELLQNCDTSIVGSFTRNERGEMYRHVEYNVGSSQFNGCTMENDYPQFALPLYNLCSNVGLYETAAITNRSNILSPKYLRLNL